MAPKAKAKADARAKAKASARPEPKAKAKAEASRPAPKRKAEEPAPSQPALKKGRSAEMLEKAKAAAASGSAGSKSRAVDSMVPDRASLKVIEDYSIKLNQTHIDANNNKFYIIQALEGGGKFYSWNRWGRVGEPGQNKLSPFPSAAPAIKDFEKKFKDKTSNNWADRASFKPKDGKYSIVETEDTEGGGDSAPMGKLTEAQIGKGQIVLDNIRTEMDKKSPSKDKLEKLSSEFYTLIPTITGRTRPPPISTEELLEAKVELLKFYLRMGFDEVQPEDKNMSPISGVMDLAVPATLKDCGVGGGSVASSTKSGEELAKRQAGNPTKKMDGKLYASIMLYTSNAIYADLNKCLRDENRSKVSKYFKYLRLLFEAMDHLPQANRKLWRGISVDLFDSKDYDEGKTITWWSVTSTTSDINVAKNFTKGCGGKCTLFTIDSKSSIDIASMSFFGNEKESLMAPGTELKVLSKKRNGNVAEIHLKEIKRVIN